MRDPRTEPQVGDRLALEGTVFEVMELAPGSVRVSVEQNSQGSHGEWSPLARFQARFLNAALPAPPPEFTPNRGPETSRDPILQKHYLDTEGGE